MSTNFRYQIFMAVSGNLGGKDPVIDHVLSSHERQTYPTTSLDENCIEFEFQTDPNCYVKLKQTYLALKLKFFKGRGYQTYNTKQRRSKSGWGGDGGGGTIGFSCSRYSYRKHFAILRFQCWSLYQQSANLQFHWIVCAQILLFQPPQRGHLWIKGTFAIRWVRL